MGTTKPKCLRTNTTGDRQAYEETRNKSNRSLRMFKTEWIEREIKDMKEELSFT